MTRTARGNLPERRIWKGAEYANIRPGGDRSNLETITRKAHLVTIFADEWTMPASSLLEDETRMNAKQFERLA